MKKRLSTFEIAKLIAQGIDPFATVRRIERAPMYRRRKVYVYRRRKVSGAAKPKRAGGRPQASLPAVS